MKGLFLGQIDGKNADTKKHIIGLCINDDYSIAELSKELNTSIPTITKLVGELIEEGFLVDMGKHGTSGGRRPSIYGLNPSAGYIAGIEVGRKSISIIITNFKGQITDYQPEIPFSLQNNIESLEGLASLIKNTIAQTGINMKEVITCGLTFSGRVNSASGYSFTYFISEDKSLASVLEDFLGVPVTIENDSRAMAFGEYLGGGVTTNEKDMLCINASWGLGMGMILDGKLYNGKSGFAGEVGHFPMLNNDIICKCGKVGCLETGASGSALHRIILEKLNDGRSSILSEKHKKGEEIRSEDILDAIMEEDVLAIEAIESIGAALGRAIAGLINIFNPELVVIGGKLALAKDYLILPIKSAVNKYSLNLVSKDTSIKLSKLGLKAGPLGACLLARSRLLELI